MSSTRAFGVLPAALVVFAIGCGIGDPEATTDHGNHGGSSGAPTSSSSGGRSSSSGSGSSSSGATSSSSSGATSSSSSGATSSSSSGATSSSSSGATSSSSSGGRSSSSSSSSGGASSSSSGGASSSGGSSGAVKSSGCGKTSTLKFSAVPNEDANASPGSGRTVGTGAGGYLTIQSGGDTRGFTVRLPDNYDNTKPYWLIFGFHWNGGTIDQIDNGGSNGYEMAYFGLQKRSNNGAIFVAPQGLGNGWANSGGRDLKLVDDIVKLIEENYCVDTTHLFANGFSYGGGMSYAIACNRAKVFRGVAIYEGAVLSGCDNGNDPIAYWQMAGLTDGTCTVGMATPMRDRFVKNNGCTAQNPPQPPQPPPYLSTGGHVCTDYAGCSSGHPVRWCVHQSGHGNAIVDGTGDLYNTCATPPKSCSASCPCSWVPDDVWKWMKAL